MNSPNNAHVEQARMNLATAQAAIVTNSAILEAAGVVNQCVGLKLPSHGWIIRQSGSSTVRKNSDYIGLFHSRLCSTIVCMPCQLSNMMS